MQLSHCLARNRPLLSAVLFTGLAFLSAAAFSYADEPAGVVVVEEDWELVLGEPDTASHAPQLSCVISPVGNVDSLFAAFDINYQSLPSFTGGGLQLQLWNDESPVASKHSPNQAPLNVAAEVVRWTQRMKLVDGQLTVEVVNGSSTSWGPFGGQGHLRLTTETSLENLNEYSPAVSVANSGIAFAGNRVEKLVLKAVRISTSTGQVAEDTTERIVHEHE